MEKDVKPGMRIEYTMDNAISKNMGACNWAKSFSYVASNARCNK